MKQCFKVHFDRIWVTSQEILKINNPCNYDNNNKTASKNVNGTDNNYIKHGRFLMMAEKITNNKIFKINSSQLLSLENFWTLLKFGPKKFGQLNFWTQICPITSLEKFKILDTY